MADYYIAGTISLTNGSAAIVGTGTAWQIANVAGGTIFVQGDGNALPLASIEDDTHATAALEWTGATGIYSYALLRATAFSEQLEANSNIMSRLLVGLEAGTLYRYDASGDTADLATYDDRPEGFAFLAIDVNPADLYIKASAASGDWAGPFSYGTGPQGPAPAVTFEPVVTGAPGSNASMNVTGSGESGDPYDITFTIPAGDLGINWRGAYSGATAYAARDGVLDNGSAWIALQATTGNAPPVLPTTSNTYWSLIAAKGTDGTGTGDVVGSGASVAGRIPRYVGTSGKTIEDSGVLVTDVVTGPASSVDGALVAFNGTTGKAVKTLTNTQAKTWLASTALDVSFSNATANLPGSPATVQAAIESVAANAGGKNDALLALEIADLKGSRMGMIGGIADAFDDQTGVNTGGSTGQVYDATNDWYAPVITQTTQTLGTAAGTVAYPASTWLDFGTFLTAGDVITAIGISLSATANISLKILKRNSPGNYDVVVSEPFTHPGGGFVDKVLTSPFTVPATGSYVLGFFMGALTNTIRTAGASRGQFNSATDQTGTNLTFTEVTNNVNIPPLRVQKNPLASNMTLLSNAFTAASAPSTARVAVQLVEVDSITINTDVTAEVSRDGGTTWTAVTLALSTNLNGVKVYEGVASVSGQPSGTSLRWRVKTLNNKNVDVSGVVMQWS